MQAAADARPSGMVSVIGLDADKAGPMMATCTWIADKNAKELATESRRQGQELAYFPSCPHGTTSILPTG